MNISSIKISNRHRRDMGDIESLAASMKDLGLLHPVVLNEDGELIAGERRIEAAKLLGWTEIETRTASGLDEIARHLRAERDENTCREPFAPSEAVSLAKALEPYEKKAAQERQSELNGKSKTASVKITQAEKGRAADKVAEAVGVSRPTLARATAVVEAAEKHPEHYGDLVEEMDRTGKVAPAYMKLAQRSAEPEKPKVRLPHKATATWEWSKAIQTLYEMFGIVTKRGGIEPLIEEWETYEIQDYYKVLTDVQKRCGEYLPILEKRLK